MHEQVFAESARPSRVSCLGLPLRTYSIGHELALIQSRNGFLLSGLNSVSDEQRNLELIRAVDICSMTYAEANFVPSTWFERRKYANVCRKWRKHLQSVVWPLESAIFQSYLASGREFMPTMSSAVPEDAEAYEIANKGEKLEGGRTLGSPLVAQLIPFCTSRLGMTHAEAMDAGFAYAGNLYFAYLEGKGGMAVENHKETEAKQTMLALRAEVEAEKDAARAAWLSAVTDADKLAAIDKHERILDLFPEAVELKGTQCPA